MQFPTTYPDGIYQHKPNRLLTWFETIRILRRERRQRHHVEIHPTGEVCPLSGFDLPAVAVSHNEINILPKFLDHYRRLGVTRFIILDDASTDGTTDFLLAQEDVDLWTSPVRFAEARRGRQWREQLFQIYGKNRWYLNLDSDEFLVFSDCESRSIPDLIKILEASGDKRLAAPMLDMYAAQYSAHHPVQDDAPWVISNYFDRCGYDISLVKRGISINGGPRGRKFKEKNELMKYPLIYWDDECFFGSSIHRPLPYGRNFPKTWGALLHFKFFINYKEKITEAVQEKQHFGGSSHYVKLLDEIKTQGAINLYDENVSVKYIDSKQLVELGFITAVTWENIR